MAGRQCELVYILPPDTTEQQMTEAAPAGRGDRVADERPDREDGQLGTPQAGLRDRPPQRKASTSSKSSTAPGELVKELDRRLKVMDQVVRHLIVRVDEEKKVVERTRTKRQTESAAPPREARPPATAATR